MHDIYVGMAELTFKIHVLLSKLFLYTQFVLITGTRGLYAVLMCASVMLTHSVLHSNKE